MVENEQKAQQQNELLFLKKTAEECMGELDSVGIPYHQPSRMKVNTRAQKRWGQCRLLPDGHYEINISSRLLKSGSEEALKRVLMHELIHTCDGCMNHGALWKYYAEIVRRGLGYPITRTNTAAELGLPVMAETTTARRSESYKHRFVCEKCGAVVMRKRESNFTRHYREYRCARCGGRFRKEY